jgi:CubicO group peptidase (beta-lactamase class C family)
MPRFLKIIIIIASVFLVLHLALVITENTHLYKGIANTYLKGKKGPQIDEYEIFHSSTIKATNPQPWPFSKNYNKTAYPKDLLKSAEDLESRAFLIIKNDSILFEKYWDDYNEKSISNSFSMGKTVVSILTGIAIKEGKVKSVDQSVGDFLEDYKTGMAAKLTVKNLITMSSGVNFDEPYGDPFGFPAKAYYGDNQRELVKEYQVVKEPGKIFEYRSGTTLILSFLLEKACGKKISPYCQEKLWNKIGAENDALWSLDREGGDEKSFSAFYATARDFARIGKLYLDSGRVRGEQIVPEDYVLASIQPANLIDEDFNKPNDRYGYSWWLCNYKNHEVFYARGINGQYVICIPDYDVIVVRLGKQRIDSPGEKHPKDFFQYLEATFSMLNLK